MVRKVGKGKKSRKNEKVGGVVQPKKCQSEAITVLGFSLGRKGHFTKPTLTRKGDTVRTERFS